MIKTTYGKPRNGRMTFSIDHTFGRGIPDHDQQTMAIKRVLKDYPNAGSFEFYRYQTTDEVDGEPSDNWRKDRPGMVCGGRFEVSP